MILPCNSLPVNPPPIPRLARAQQRRQKGPPPPDEMETESINSTTWQDHAGEVAENTIDETQVTNEIQQQEAEEPGPPASQTTRPVRTRNPPRRLTYWTPGNPFGNIPTTGNLNNITGHVQQPGYPEIFHMAAQLTEFSAFQSP